MHRGFSGSYVWHRYDLCPSPLTPKKTLASAGVLSMGMLFQAESGSIGAFGERKFKADGTNETDWSNLYRNTCCYSMLSLCA